MAALTSEKIMVFSFCILMTIAITGLPYLRYAVYIIPAWAMFIWILGNRHNLNTSTMNVAFILLMVLSLASFYPWDFNTFKKVFFIYVFSSVFILFDFSRVKIDLRYLGVFFLFLSILTEVLQYSGRQSVTYSIIESKSMFESTFAFPLGLFALYFFIQKKYLWFLIFSVFLILFLKRVVLLAIILCILTWLTPRNLRKFFLNPFVVTVISLLIVIISIDFAQGTYDQFIFNFFERSPNDLSKGRQLLWGSALSAIKFSYDGFILWGVGIGKVVSDLQTTLYMERVLLHSDLLSLVLEIGIIPFTIFIYLLNNQKNHDQRLISLYLVIMFVTDNVLIYQHVMFVYFFIQSQLIREVNENSMLVEKK